MIRGLVQKFIIMGDVPLKSHDLLRSDLFEKSS